MAKQSDKVMRTKEHIETAFINLYEHKDIEKISIKSITDVAHVYRSTFYLYYQDIYDLLERVESQQLMSFKEYVNQQLPLTSVNTCLQKMVLYFKSNGDLLYLLMRKSRNYQFENLVKKVVQQTIQDVLNVKQLDDHLALILNYITNAFMFFIKDCFEQHVPVENYYPLVTDLLHHGVLNQLKPYLEEATVLDRL